MARRIAAGCSHRDARGPCPNLAVHRGRCADHQRGPWQKRPDQPRVYDAAWTRFATRWLREHPLCVVCGAKATVADHIIPVAEGGAHCSPANTQSLCDEHHDEKTQQESLRGRARRGFQRD